MRVSSNNGQPMLLSHYISTDGRGTIISGRHSEMKYPHSSATALLSFIQRSPDGDVWMPFNQAKKMTWLKSKDYKESKLRCFSGRRSPRSPSADSCPFQCHVSRAGRIFRSRFFSRPASVTQAVREQYRPFTLLRHHCFHLTHNNGCPGTFNHHQQLLSTSQPLELAAPVFSGFPLYRSFWLADSQGKRRMAG